MRAASWFHDGAAQGPAKTGYGNNWVVLAVRVRPPMISRPVAIPVMAKLVVKGTNSASRLWLARRMVTRLAAELPGGEPAPPPIPPTPGRSSSSSGRRDLDDQAASKRRLS